MRRRCALALIIVPFMVGCTKNMYRGEPRLKGDGSVVTLYIPEEYLDGYDAGKNLPSVWVQFSYPDLKPDHHGYASHNGISLLMLEVAGRKTRAEYYLQTEMPYTTLSDLKDNSEVELNKLHRVRNSPQADPGEHYFARSEDKQVICYEVTPGLNFNVLRRYFDALELRYVIDPYLLAQRNEVDKAIISLVRRFLNISSERNAAVRF